MGKNMGDRECLACQPSRSLILPSRICDVLIPRSSDNNPPSGMSICNPSVTLNGLLKWKHRVNQWSDLACESSRVSPTRLN